MRSVSHCPYSLRFRPCSLVAVLQFPRAAIIAEVKMVRSRIVKIDGALDETQTEQPGIEIEVPLRIAGDRSDVMQSRNFAVYDDLPITSFPRSMSRHLFHW
jgi:hypothetical protein